jgi:hypothetical protein
LMGLIFVTSLSVRLLTRGGFRSTL